MYELPEFGEIVEEDVTFEEFVKRYIGNFEYVWQTKTVIKKFHGAEDHRNIQVFLWEFLRYVLAAHDSGCVIFGGIPLYIKEKQALRRPDLAVFIGKRHDDIKLPYLESGIDIAIEISSFATTVLDRGHKFVEYELAGVQEYWMIDYVRKDSLIYSLKNDGLYERIADNNLLKSRILPDFELDLNLIWQGNLPRGHAARQLANQLLPDDMRDNIKIIFYEGRDLHLKIHSDTLIQADLTGKDLHRAIFEEENLSYAILNDAHARNAIFWKSDLSHAQLVGTNLVMAYLEDATLFEANLSNSHLYHTDFVEANLTGAILKDADVQGAKFDKATLCGADMRCKRLEDATFTEAIYDSATIWSDGFDPQKHGAIPS